MKTFTEEAIETAVDQSMSRLGHANASRYPTMILIEVKLEIYEDRFEPRLRKCRLTIIDQYEAGEFESLREALITFGKTAVLLTGHKLIEQATV